MKIPLTIVAAFLLQSAYAQMDIYIFAGQSNMQGAAPFQNEPTPQNAGRLEMYNQYGQFVQAHEPTSVYYPNSKGMGPALWAADRLATLTGHTIGIINVAVGGTWLWQWAPDYYDQSLYGRMMACVRNAQAYGTIKGFFWYQGESDSDNANDVHAYGPQMYRLFEALRNDLGVPIVFVQLGPDPHEPGFPYWTAIQQIQAGIARGCPSWISMVSAEKLSAAGMPSPHHLNQASQITLGAQMGQAMWQLLGGQ